MRVMMRRFTTFGTTLPSIMGRSRYSGFFDIAQVPSLREVPFRLSLVPSRNRGDNFSGSRRKKLMREKKEADKLEKQLEKKYGVKLKDDPPTPAEWLKNNYFVEFLAFQSRLGIEFEDHSVLLRALAHTSFTEDLENVDRTQVLEGSDRDLKNRLKLCNALSKKVSYLQLGLIGFEITSLAIKEELYKIYPNITPWICQCITNFLMSRETISMLVQGLSIKDLILLSREFDATEDMNQELHLHFSKQDILCDTFYSVIGAINKDIGEEAAKSFINDFLISLIHYEDLSVYVTSDHPEAQLGQILQLNGINPDVEVRTIVETGIRAEMPIYYVGVYSNGYKIAHGAHLDIKRAKNDGLHNAIYGCLQGDINLDNIKSAQNLTAE